MLRGILALVGLAVSTAAGAAPFDPRAHRVFAGPASEVLVLGTPHLASLPDGFKTEQLTPLLDRLARWKPEIITIEAVNGPQCEMLRGYAPLHPGAADSYCLDTSNAFKATGLDVRAAALAAEEILAKWPQAPAPAQRRHLAAVFLAAGNYSSALVQWLRLPPDQRVAGDGLDAALVAFLTNRQASRNENYSVGAALAARLGLERVYPIDDHTADNTASTDPGYKPAFARIWSGPKLTARKAASDALYARLGQPDALLAMYRAANAPAEARVAFDSDFGAALRDDTPPKQFGRQYVAWWETRNLRMVANIRAAMTMRPRRARTQYRRCFAQGLFRRLPGHDARRPLGRRTRPASLAAHPRQVPARAPDDADQEQAECQRDDRDRHDCRQLRQPIGADYRQDQAQHRKCQTRGASPPRNLLQLVQIGGALTGIAQVRRGHQTTAGASNANFGIVASNTDPSAAVIR